MSRSYVHVVSNNRAAAAADFLGLESLGWIDNLTRAVAVEISTFTPGSNVFSTLTLVRVCARMSKLPQPADASFR